MSLSSIIWLACLMGGCVGALHGPQFHYHTHIGYTHRLHIKSWYFSDAFVQIESANMLLFIITLQVCTSSMNQSSSTRWSFNRNCDALASLITTNVYTRENCCSSSMIIQYYACHIHFKVIHSCHLYQSNNIYCIAKHIENINLKNKLVGILVIF